MKGQNDKSESLLYSREVSFILLTINHIKKGKIEDIEDFIKTKPSLIAAKIKKMEKLGLVKTEENTFSVNWDVLMSQILVMQKYFMRGDQNIDKILGPYHGLTLGQLDELFSRLEGNPHLREFYQKFMTSYFFYIHDSMISCRSISDLFSRDFFIFLERYRDRLMKTVPKATSGEGRDFLKFIDFAKGARIIETIEVISWRDAFDELSFRSF